MRVAIIGMGIVGQAQAAMFSGHELITYDITDEEYPATRLANAHFAVIAVGTPSLGDGSCDMSQVDAAIERLPRYMPVLIRSTVLPGTTDRWQAKRRSALFCFAPEFMHERKEGVWQRSDDVPFMLLGGNGPSLEFFRPALQQVYSGEIHEFAAVDVEMAKYVANLHWALRVTFVNEMSRISQHLGADWDQVRLAWLKDTRVGTAEYTRMAGFEPGYGGRCWPKDILAMICAGADAGYQPEFLMSIVNANARFRS